MWIPVVLAPFLNRVSICVAASTPSEIMIYAPVVYVVFIGSNLLFSQCFVICILTALMTEYLHIG